MLIGVAHSRGKHLFAGHLSSAETELLCRDSGEVGVGALIAENSPHFTVLSCHTWPGGPENTLASPSSSQSAFHLPTHSAHTQDIAVWVQASGTARGSQVGTGSWGGAGKFLYLSGSGEESQNKTQRKRESKKAKRCFGR